MFLWIKNKDSSIQDIWERLVYPDRRCSDVELHRVFGYLLDWRDIKEIESRIKRHSSQAMILSWDWKKPPHEIYIWEGKSVVWMWKGYIIVHDENTRQTSWWKYVQTGDKKNEIMVLLDEDC